MNSTFKTLFRRVTTLLLSGLFLAVLAPADKRDLGNMVVVGDSLSAGFQNGVLRGCQQMKGYANVVATQAGSALILPLIQDPGFGPGVPTNVAPGFRVSPRTQATDLAVPGQTAGQALTMIPDFYNHPFPFYTPTVPEDGAQIMTNLVLGYPGFFATPKVGLSQVQWANALQPQAETIIVWLGSNDVLGVFEGVQSGITDPVTFAKNLDQVLSALATNNRKIIVANIPDVTVLPFMAQFLNGNPTLRNQLKLTVAWYNLAIQGLAFRYGAPVVDIFSLVNTLATNGITVNKTMLTTEANGGLFSLDNTHPTDVGYAIIANEFINTINRRFPGIKIQPVNLAKVALTDPLFPPNVGKVAFCTTN